MKEWGGAPPIYTDFPSDFLLGLTWLTYWGRPTLGKYKNNFIFIFFLCILSLGFTLIVSRVYMSNYISIISRRRYKEIQSVLPDPLAEGEGSADPRFRSESGSGSVKDPPCCRRREAGKRILLVGNGSRRSANGSRKSDMDPEKMIRIRGLCRDTRVLVGRTCSLAGEFNIF